MEKQMNINEMQEDLTAKLEALEGMEETHSDYAEALEAAEGLKAKIDSAQANAKRVADLKASAEKFEPAKTKQNIGFKNFGAKPCFTEDPKCGFETAGHFLQAVVKFGNRPFQDERLAHLVQTSGTHTTENDGLMIPTEYAQGLLLNESGIDDSDWLSRMNVEQTSSNSKTFKRSSSNTLGGATGITCARIAENTQMSSTREVFETVTLPLDKLYTYTNVTDEDLEDIPWLAGHLTMQAPKVKRKFIAGEYLNGTGVGEAEGMFNTNNSNKIAVTRDTASSFKAEDVASMYARHIVGSGSFWLINKDVTAQLPLMSVSNMPVYQPDFRQGMVGILMGLPVYESEHNSALGTQGDVRLINPDGYRCLEKVGGSKFSTSAHVKFDYDVMAFKWTHRITGKSWSNDVYTPTNGSTLSAFVELN
jgi:HK97 family phage major capsid protein